MNNNKIVLKYCPNFYKIINFNPLVADELTDKIIKMYQEYIFKIDINNSDEVEKIKKLDEALSRYINDFNFRGELQRKIRNVRIQRDCKDILKAFVDAILNIFSDYQDATTRIIYISRWI